MRIINLVSKTWDPSKFIFSTFKIGQFLDLRQMPPHPMTAYDQQFFPEIVREGFNKKIKSYGRFIKVLPPHLLRKTNICFPNFWLCLYYVYSHQIWRQHLYLFWTRNSKSKSLTIAEISAITSQIIKNKVFSFLDELDRSDHLYNFKEKNIPPQYWKIHNLLKHSLRDITKMMFAKLYLNIILR